MASTPQTPAEVLVGRYTLTKNIRKGAQATVTQAFDSQLGKMVAIKRVKFGPDDERGQAGFHREVEMLQRLNHRNIVEVIDVDQDDDGHWFLVLDWVAMNLEDVIIRDGAMAWQVFWDRFGEPLLEAIAFAHKGKIAHRDVKPKNILVTDDGTAKLADYGIAKLLDNGGSWAPVAGITFRFDRTPGYTPPSPEEDHAFARDCYAFAAVALSCVTGRTFNSDAELLTALQEATLPVNVRPIVERCLNADATQRPPLASLLLEQLRQASATDDGRDGSIIDLHLRMNDKTKFALERRLDTDDVNMVERFIAEELGEACALVARPEQDGELPRIDLISGAWKFEALVTGKQHELLHITSASEIGAGLAADLREGGLIRRVRARFVRPEDERRAGQQLSLLLSEASSLGARLREERAARATQRIFRVWGSYLRDRADREAKRKNAIKYVHRNVGIDRVVFTTEIAQPEDIVGQDRIVESGGGRISGRIVAATFNLVTMEVLFGDASRLPPRGELSINTLAAQRALTHQTHALNAVLYDRAVDGALKPIILDPKSATPCIPVANVRPTDPDFDDEKLTILKKALGVQDILAIEGPPGTGKTKLITEIVVQWLKQHPKHRILLSSQTHIALDNVLERVTQLDPSLDVIRIGRADEPRISAASKELLLERRVEKWISEVRAAAEEDMNRWATENNVDRATVATGMKVEGLLQIRRRQEEMQFAIDDLKAEKEEVQAEIDEKSSSVDEQELDEESTQLDSDIGELQREITKLRNKERSFIAEMDSMGGYAADLAKSGDSAELADWAVHFLQGDEVVMACRDRLVLLEDWQLRVGRSPDFNAAMLSSAQIIAGTCVGIAGVKGMDDVAYDLCIIDEASKATATETLIPMARSRKWIVVGDPQQLPPFFEELGDDLLDSFDEREVKQTLLDRFLDPDDGLPDGCRDKLRNQYRMVKPIGDLVSHCFYDDDLDSPVTSHGLKLSAAIPKSVTWYSTHALKQPYERQDGQTFNNPTEVAVVRSLLLKLQFLAKAQKKRISVAVIAGYTSQVTALNDMVLRGIAEWPDLDVTCNSVDAFQGRQADVCIYSVVRSNPQNRLGFLKEKPRLNVALSRGKSALLIVGDQMFCRSAKGRNPFRKVLDYFDAHEDTCEMETLS
ncbi:AAA domain-containing protein [Sphingomonas sp.]|jgi:tRNA A-37 threonylcarbamoyl transferase component Bud32|uniref:AAA domain-containing protein n=1 Tax=Sphingomonas sp. TaxID=28214 RepID=UPI0035656A9D